MDTRTRFGTLRGTLLAVMLSACGGACAAGVGYKCNYDVNRRFAPLDMRDYGACIQRRKDDKGGAIELKDTSVFATTCPVTISSIEQHAGSKCKEVKRALKLGYMLRVDEWGDGKLEFTLKEGATVVASSPLTALNLLLGGTTPRTIGYYADVTLPAVSTAEPEVNVRYIIYLSHHKQAGQAVRYYSVEVFEDSADCKKEYPSDTLSSVVTQCNDIAAELPDPEQKCEEITEDGQLPSGGGGEPPPKN